MEKFESLPGIGHKNAQRLAYHVLDMTREEAESFASAIVEAHEKIHYCSVCCNLTDSELCPVCRNDLRDKSVICVVEEPKDVFALERAGEYNAPVPCAARGHFPPCPASALISFGSRSCLPA